METVSEDVTKTASTATLLKTYNDCFREYLAAVDAVAQYEKDLPALTRLREQQQSAWSKKSSAETALLNALRGSAETAGAGNKQSEGSA